MTSVARSDPPRVAVVGALPSTTIETTPTGADRTDEPDAIAWLPSRGRECPRRGPYRNFCQGPRRAPQPHGEAAELASQLGLGTKATVNHVLTGSPRTDWVEHVPTENAASDLLWPVDGGRLWRGFGKVRKGKRKKLPHQGIDIGAPDGTPIRAVNDALVIYADNEVRGYGNLMVLVHADASVTFYAHCTTLFFFPGQTVTRGQVIAEVGHTGIARGSHLHFEYRVRGHARDPQPKLAATPDGDGESTPRPTDTVGQAESVPE